MKNVFLYFMGVGAIFLGDGCAKILSSISPLAKIGSHIISNYDLKKRIKLEAFLKGESATSLNGPKMRKEILDKMIKEAYAQEFFQKMSIKLEVKELESAIDAMARSGGKTRAQFYKELKNEGIDETLFKKVMSTKILWDSYLRQRFSDKVKVSKKEIAGEKDKIKSLLKKPFYQVFEIIISSKKEGAKILHLIKEGYSFRELALQHSKAASAKEGGALAARVFEDFDSNYQKIISSQKRDEIFGPISIKGGRWMIGLVSQVFLKEKDLPKISDAQIKEGLYEKKILLFEREALDGMRPYIQAEYY